MKKILFICLTLLLNACIVPPPFASSYGSYGYGAVSPNRYYQQPYYSNRNYQQPYYNNFSHERHEHWGGGGYQHNGGGGRYR